jgi:outer membrane protein insertion porin family
MFTVRISKLIALIITLTLSFNNISIAYAEATEYNQLSENWIIKSIVVQGNQRVEKETIESYLAFEKGAKFRHTDLDESLKKLFSIGLFKDVKINTDPAKRTIYIKLEENPTINQIAFEGNKRVKKDDLLSEISLKPRMVYNKVKLQSDVNKILDIYSKSGRYAATINPKVIQLPQNRINLVFEINEGPKTLVKKIIFVGNKSFNDNKLSSIINTKQSAWFRLLSSSDHYDPDKLDYDKELLRRFYLSMGYADFKVISAIADITPDRSSFIITFTLDEGEMYKFGKVDVESKIEKVNINAIKKLIKTKQGKIFNSELLEDTTEAFTKYLNNNGYAFVSVEPELEKNTADTTIAVKYIINESKKVYINRINITGNSRTTDKVIRREVRLAEGDPYNASLLDRSEQRIRNLDYFDKVDITTARTDEDDKVDVNIDVAEKSTANINFGVGYSTADGPVGKIGLTETNLLGNGQELNFVVSKAEKRGDIDLSFTEPYFMDKDLSAGFDLFTNTHDLKESSSYKSDTKGFSLRAGYEITEYLRHTLRYTYRVDKVKAADDASRFIQEQKGTNRLSSIGHNFIYDKTNNRMRPSEGYFIKLSQEYAGLGGTAKYLRHELNSAYYIPVHKRDVVLKISGNAGNIHALNGKQVKIHERFFLGGDDLRGFKTAGVGPTDKVTRDALGGNNYYTVSSELTFPLGLPKEFDVSGAVFADAGSLWGVDVPKSQRELKRATMWDKHSIRASAGVGVVWISTIGPMSFYLSYPIKYEKHVDRKQIFTFTFKTPF